jgi:hypothetical protein
VGCGESGVWEGGGEVENIVGVIVPGYVGEGVPVGQEPSQYQVGETYCWAFVRERVFSWTRRELLILMIIAITRRTLTRMDNCAGRESLVNFSLTDCKY